MHNLDDGRCGNQSDIGSIVVKCTYSFDQIARRYDQYVFSVSYFVQLGEKSIDDLDGMNSTNKFRWKWKGLTRKPSDGSVPAIAPALAAVNDSTSSTGTKSEHLEWASLRRTDQ
jgi:hypothetical protein